ncbi:deoxyribodipyrimidine photo-lyase [Commensalibacter oyaizuii]|uniref:Deoxyribodipyrimidine photo-lyase n=1 Tax=Commensalibacter oyaizuii TaxID=3043873 RepID=A0ABT6Q375_9PROT|nr:deoxyribodipyrimidine photo-lyase [Commensalibacter sp. TBRC 16381]MDI2091443.1 deoxyribodipyrimidine photo-lyase [Commensalibacter sp. TBRC 16381]
MTTHLVWFRNDLRVRDNPALSKACEDSDAVVLALFVETPNQWESHHMSPRQAQFIHDNLKHLQTELAKLNIPLLYECCNDFTETVSRVVDICKQHQVDSLFYNRQYEINEHKRDLQVKQELSPAVICQEFDGNLFVPPLSVHNKQGTMYKVFSPFQRAFIKFYMQREHPIYPKPSKRNHSCSDTPLPKPTYPTKPYEFFKAGETAARQKLEEYCDKFVEDYNKYRDFPSKNYTSQLSAYLTLGVLSVRQCFHHLSQKHPSFLKDRQNGAFAWFSELIWREFYHHLIVAHSYLCKHKPFIEWTDHIQWQNNTDHFEKWKSGQTGYPIVDAAMRQLNETGWMHNRLRMITASFLVKDLLIDWRWGERYFMSELTDGDFAANNGGWQWAASTGTDPVPYFRIFNPTTQGKRFDPEGFFIREWVPELKQVPSKFIHTPHQWAENTGKPLKYPNPIVIHNIARKKTLEAFEKAKK